MGLDGSQRIVQKQSPLGRSVFKVKRPDLRALQDFRFKTLESLHPNQQREDTLLQLVRSPLSHSGNPADESPGKIRSAFL